MTLTPGTRLGPYEIQAAIGAGGMGEVYKARDTRLDRSVAIKVLPPAFSADPDRRARFEREAKTIAALTHPHVCTLHDVGEHEGSTFLVMEHLTGETLAARLQKGPLPLDQALTVATEIADALSAAHRQGVIHRDLKPGNVMLTKAGAKLLDFGLAKLKGHGEQPAAAHVASAPTQSTPLTAEGMIVGTLQYMAPEQLEGKAADARTDLWALGAILYELVTGKRAFEGTSAASLIGAILEREPAPVSTVQPLTAPAVDRLVRQCLAKSPDDRPDTAHDVANELRWVRESSGAPVQPAVRLRGRRMLRIALMVAGALAMGVGGAGVTWLLRPSPSVTSTVRSALPVSPAETLNAGGAEPQWVQTPGGSRTALAWTPDGQGLIFVGRRGGVQQLYVRRLDAAEARPLSGTEGAQAPAVSPDGQWVAFWADRAIRKVPVGGGPVTILASDHPPPLGLIWDTRGRLYYGTRDGPIWQIPPAGEPAAVTRVAEAELTHSLPWPLPGERALLYTVRRRNTSWGDEVVVAQTLATGARTVLLKDAVDARYLASGHLAFLRRGQLFAVAFDVERLEVQGTPVAVLDSVAQALSAGNDFDVTGAGQFAIAPTGTLAWISAPLVPYADCVLVAVDRHGHVTRLPVPARGFAGHVRISPDGRRLATAILTLTDAGVWMYDMDRGALTVLAGRGEASIPIWSPDGRRLVFDWLEDGRRTLAVQHADGTTTPQTIVEGQLEPASFTPDGGQMSAVAGRREIMIVNMKDGKATVQPLMETPDRQASPEFSPDGRWLAYTSNVSGRGEVYVRPYPGPGTAEQISLDGGRDPSWNPNGRELFYLSGLDPVGKRRMMAVDFAVGAPPRIGRPRSLFEFDTRALSFSCTPVRCYDVAPDGQRFYVTEIPTPQPPPVVTHINLIQNWFEELKAKVPTGR